MRPRAVDKVSCMTNGHWPPRWFEPICQWPCNSAAKAGCEGGCRCNCSGTMLRSMKDAFDFSGKVALVTGSSRGIGAALITALGQLGARCVTNYVADADGRNKADAERVAAGLTHALVIQANVGNPEHVCAMMERVKKELGGLDILVNNAGIL